VPLESPRNLTVVHMDSRCSPRKLECKVRI
jgi:hypothetical protein